MISIVDYKAGNLTSVKRALDYLSIPCRITASSEDISNAERIIFPGVGHAQTAMANLKDRALDRALKSAFEKGTPIMGICLGTQIILSDSEEGNTPCLGLIPGTVPRFRLTNPDLKIPHMGWNRIVIEKKHFILQDTKPDTEFYFVHSYYPSPSDLKYVYARTEYEIKFPSALGYKNLFAVQFHPEKSGPAGLSLLKKFSMWDGRNAE